MTAFPVETEEELSKRINYILENDSSLVALREKQAKERERRKHSKFHQPRIPLKPNQIFHYYGITDDSSMDDFNMDELSSDNIKTPTNSSSTRSVKKRKSVLRYVRSAVSASAKLIRRSFSPHRNKSTSIEDAREASSNFSFPRTPSSLLNSTNRSGSTGFTSLANNSEYRRMRLKLNQDESMIKLREMQVRRRCSKFNQRRIPLKPGQIPHYYGFAERSPSFVSSSSSSSAGSLGGRSIGIHDEVFDFNGTDHGATESQLSASEGDTSISTAKDVTEVMARTGEKRKIAKRVMFVSKAKVAKVSASPPPKRNVMSKNPACNSRRSSTKRRSKKPANGSPRGGSEYVQVKTPKMVRNASPDPNRRRSTRNRITPVACHMGQRVIYEYKNGVGTLVGVNNVKFKRRDRSKYFVGAVQLEAVPDDV